MYKYNYTYIYVHRQQGKEKTTVEYIIYTVHNIIRIQNAQAQSLKDILYSMYTYYHIICTRKIIYIYKKEEIGMEYEVTHCLCIGCKYE